MPILVTVDGLTAQDRVDFWHDACSQTFVGAGYREVREFQQQDHDHDRNVVVRPPPRDRVPDPARGGAPRGAATSRSATTRLTDSWVRLDASR
jgi:hypothetical protein